MRQLVLTLVEPSRAEPSCVQYIVHENPDDPGKFVFYEVWKDDAAFAAHGKMPHMAAFGPKIAHLRAPSPPVRKLRVIA